MAARRSRPALRDMLEAIEVVEAAMAGKDEGDLAADRQLRYAVQRGIEIISEASRRLPPRLTSQHPSVPWHDVRSIGNILRHEYDKISDRIIYDLIRSDLPLLKAAILAIDAALDEPEE